MTVIEEETIRREAAAEFTDLLAAQLALIWSLTGHLARTPVYSLVAPRMIPRSFWLMVCAFALLPAVARLGSIFPLIWSSVWKSSGAPAAHSMALTR